MSFDDDRGFGEEEAVSNGHHFHHTPHMHTGHKTGPATYFPIDPTPCPPEPPAPPLDGP